MNCCAPRFAFHRDGCGGLKKVFVFAGRISKRANKKSGLFATFRLCCDSNAYREDCFVNVAIFSAKKYDREFLDAVNGSLHKLRFFEPHLNEETVGLASGFEAVCVFVNDQVNAAVIEKLPSVRRAADRVALRRLQQR